MERTLSVYQRYIKIQTDLNPIFMAEETAIVEEKEVKEREPYFKKE